MHSGSHPASATSFGHPCPTRNSSPPLVRASSKTRRNLIARLKGCSRTKRLKLLSDIFHPLGSAWTNWATCLLRRRISILQERQNRANAGQAGHYLFRRNFKNKRTHRAIHRLRLHLYEPYFGEVDLQAGGHTRGPLAKSEAERSKARRYLHATGTHDRHGQWGRYISRCPGRMGSENISTPPAPPPPDVEPLPTDTRGAASIRERLDLHRKNEACSSCHVKIDPMGFAFENFDVVGRWRDKYRGDRNPIDASSVMANGQEIADIVEFKKMLKDRKHLGHFLPDQENAYLCHRPSPRSGRPWRSGPHRRRTRQKGQSFARPHSLGGEERYLSFQIIQHPAGEYPPDKTMNLFYSLQNLPRLFGHFARLQSKAAAKLPNIIFIMVDDMGYHDLGCYGSKTIQTPNADRMAREGMRFTDCYSGDTVCASARSTLMTGYHKGHTPVRGNSGGIPLFRGSPRWPRCSRKRGMQQVVSASGVGQPRQGRSSRATRVRPLLRLLQPMACTHLLHPSFPQQQEGRIERALYSPCNLRRNHQIHQGQQGQAVLSLLPVDSAACRLPDPRGRAPPGESTRTSHGRARTPRWRPPWTP